MPRISSAKLNNFSRLEPTLHLLGVQFDALLSDGLYFDISRHANALADRIRATLAELNLPLLVPGTTNQIFAILPDFMLDELSKEFAYNVEKRMDQTHRAVRFCTSWATNTENVDILCQRLTELANNL